MLVWDNEIYLELQHFFVKLWEHDSLLYCKQIPYQHNREYEQQNFIP